MGLYPIACSHCSKMFTWFSGNTGDQRCEHCQKEKFLRPEELAPSVVNSSTLSSIITTSQPVTHSLKQVNYLEMGNEHSECVSSIPGSFVELIEYHECQTQGDLHYVDIKYKDGRLKRVFQLVHVEFLQ